MIITFILGTIRSERPSYARLLSGPPLSCTYQGRKYPHGEQVITSEPCLNCTCKRGVLLCFLRVCPSQIHLHIDENCETIREPGQCCPTVRCTSRAAPVTLTTDPTEPWPEDREESGGDHDSQTTPFSAPQEVPNSLTPELNAEFDTALRTKLAKGSNNRIVVSHNNETTIFQTNPTTVFHDSPKLVTSSPGHYSYSKDDIDNFPTILNRINRDCYLNSTLYAEGSAVMSSSYCEYCYCIRGKKMCIRPRCHLAILGCIPRYTSEYACCPTSYICGNSPNPSISLDERTLSPSQGFTSPYDNKTFDGQYIRI
uniref:VWFC domain-containing protein n=1 Tax=Tetranychus urticae TaxID=32264 RepID=T1KTK7_TETUR